MQSVYAPLSQYLSDSDSEKEIIMEQVFTTNWNSNILSNVNVKSNGIPREEYQMNNNINQNKIKTKRVRFAMSNSRKAAFVTSIIFCFLPVIIFLWVVPCNNSAICAVKVSNWKTTLDFMEFRGQINLVEGSFQEQNLALMYKGSFNDPKPLKNGILAFSGRSGSVLWNFEQETCPLKMNCNMIDIDLDGFMDCLLLDETGLKAINSLNGKLIWHFHSVQKLPLDVEKLNFPVLLNDFDNDGFTDLLLLAKKELFLVISGQRGNALCSIKIPACVYIEDVETQYEAVIFRCIFSNDTKVYYQTSFSNLNLKCKYTDRDIPLKTIVKNNETKDGKVFKSGKQQLSVHVSGQCPHCHSSVAFFYTKEAIVKSWSYEDAMVSTPLPFYLNYTHDSIVNGHINGFIFKVWQWQRNPEELSPSTQIHRRKLPGDNKTTYRLYVVSERVILLSFYENFTHDINVSMNEVYVICRSQDMSDCQPDYKNQQLSLQIADLDRDNSLELIRYYNSYEKEKLGGIINWNLRSKLRVFRLAEELPKLYKNKK